MQGCEEAYEYIMTSREWGGYVKGNLYHRWYPQINFDDIEDILSIGTFKLWRTLTRKPGDEGARYDESKGPLRPYYAGICVKEACTMLRKRQRDSDRLDRYADTYVVDSYQEPAEKKIDEERQPPGRNPQPRPPQTVHEAVNAFLENLAPQDQKIMRASTGGGRWAKKLEGRINVPSNRISQRAFRLKGQLATYLKQLFPDIDHDSSPEQA